MATGAGRVKNEDLAVTLAEEVRAGGFTVKWPKDVRIPGAGSGTIGPWVCSIGGQEMRTPSSNEHLAGFIDLYADHRDTLLRNPRHWLGGWLSEGNAVLDVSRVFAQGERGYRAAMDFGRRSQQEAIYDAGRDLEFPLDWPWEKALAGVTPEEDQVDDDGGGDVV